LRQKHTIKDEAFPSKVEIGDTGVTSVYLTEQKMGVVMYRAQCVGAHLICNQTRALILLLPLKAFYYRCARPVLALLLDCWWLQTAVP